MADIHSLNRKDTEIGASTAEITASGKPVCILRACDDHTFELDEDELEKILLAPNIRNKKAVVVSVAGAFRKGKSFLLDFFLRYLTRSKNGEGNWLGSEDEALTGFSWRGGAERDTTGVLMWNQGFPCKLPNGNEVVVLLLDTQGAFDSSSTVRDCATVFALSTMISSVQVFNLSSNIQEDDLQHLQLFTEYGRLAMNETDQKPFQRLEFLVRDWSYPYEYDYGQSEELLSKRLEIIENQHEELTRVRRHIKNCFEKIGCFLMPHPGKVVATNPRFDGRLKDIDEEFKVYLSKLVPYILCPDQLLVKSINGSDVTCRGLVEYFKSYVKIYQGDELPEPKSMLQATAEANNLAALATAKDQYNRDMEKICGGDTPYLAPGELENRHEVVRARALTLFRATRKMGGDEFSLEFAQRLESEIDECFDNFAKLNDSKNIFNAARTPAVFLVILMMAYILSGFFTMVGVTSVANLFNIALGIALIGIVLWAYVRFSGELRDIGTQLDSIAEWIWDEIFMKIYGEAMKQGTQAMVRRQQSRRDKKQK